MRILFIVQRFMPHLSGSEQVVYEIAKRLSSANNHVDIFTSDAYDLEYFWLRNRRREYKRIQKISNINVYRFRIFHYPFEKYLRKILSVVPFLAFKCMFSFPSPFVPGLLVKSFIASFNYDIVHATCFPYDSLIYCAFKIAKKNNIPFVVTPLIHLGEKGSQSVSRFYTRKSQRKMLELSETVLVNTVCEKKYLQKAGIEMNKVHIVPPAITPIQLSGGNKKTFLEDIKIQNKIVVGHLAAKSYDKGTIHLVESMKMLWKKGIDAILVLAGVEMADFKKYYSGLSVTLREKIICLDFIDEQTKKNFFAAIDIFALPSRTDSFGIVFLEAWFYKKPVIGADAGGIPYVIEHNIDGYIIPFGDIIELAKKIEILIKDKSLAKQFGDHGYAKTINNFDWDKQTRKIYQIYKSLI